MSGILNPVVSIMGIANDEAHQRRTHHENRSPPDSFS